MLKDALKEVLNEKEIRSLHSAFDTVGDIVIIKIPEILIPKKQLIAQAILERVKSVKTVLRQVTPVEGDYRTRGLEWIAGEERTETLYAEHGCKFKVDLANVYFSPRLSTERLRVAEQVQPGECVTNMFGGVGTFSLVIAKKQIVSKNYTIDINPEAHRLAIENIKLNKVADRVTPILGDAHDTVHRLLNGVADRVLMPLPEKASDYLESALCALKPSGGIIHYYTHVRGKTSQDAVKLAKNDLAENLKTSHEILHSSVVREVGARCYQVVCDARIGEPMVRI